MYIHNRLGMIEGVETMLAQERRLDQAANNLANVDTVGYKRESVTFWEMLYNVTRDRQRVGKALNILTDQQQGNTQPTGNPLDLAITGDGFFRIQTDQGVRYSRAGNFELDPLGQLRLPGGGLVLGDGGPVVLESADFSVDRHGRILVDGAMVNQLEIVTVNDLTALVKEGRNLFRLTEEGEEMAALDFQVRQGFLEKSNVNSMEEMTSMIDLYRNYEAQQKMVQAVDEMDDLAVRRVGKLG
ncbi:MAG TPA: flagellar basal-body rod protein FlgF [Desulfurivibrio alkaliphilus]|uniref:Flagellar basal-body rod protein FlgF n=1 Tax=Desulfurivibrio alkaliphilus TaxID=427923 RepID=A0A7C2TIK7_9BACT|nr:flagellar basal-body rod protein FlgF [Desulfurivibrio alkaliphilus]